MQGVGNSVCETVSSMFDLGRCQAPARAVVRVRVVVVGGAVVLGRASVVVVIVESGLKDEVPFQFQKSF